MSSNRDTVTPSASEHLLGRVKWFNNKAGYGFITVTDGPKSGSDIFVHHSAINVDSQQYRYLIQGEYVEFNLVKTESGKHEWQASQVSGVRGGKLMCETRRELKIARSDYKTTKRSDDTEEVAQPKAPRQKVPKEVSSKLKKTYEQKESVENNDNNGKQWTLVGKDNDKKKRTQKPKSATKTSN